MNIVILDAKTLGDDMDVSIFEELGKTEVFPSTAPEEVEERIRYADIVILNKIKLNESNLKNAENLKLICITATGFDNVDIEYCRTHNIAVCNVTGYSTQSVAQLTVSMALSLITHLPEYNKSVESGEYTRSGVHNKLIPVYHEICGMTWGIIGYGNIGRQVGRVAEALGCRVIVNKRTPSPDIECVDIDTLCSEADIISIHAPLSDETRGLISREKIGLMKNFAIVINVARGAVVDEAALCDAVKTGRIGGLASDVFSVEPMQHDSPYNNVMHLPNVCLTPHMAWGAYEARVRCLEEIKLNIKAFLNGEKRNRV